MPLKFIFLNFDLGHNSGHTLNGRSGKHYGGPSRWSLKYCAQAIPAEFATERDFVLAMKDIALTYSLYGRAWVPIPVTEEAAAPAVAAPAIDSDIQTFEMPAETIGTVKTVSESVPALTEDAHTFTAKTPYKLLVKVAKDLGVDIAACNSNAERAALINEAGKQQEPALA